MTTKMIYSFKIQPRAPLKLSRKVCCRKLHSSPDYRVPLEEKFRCSATQTKKTMMKSSHKLNLLPLLHSSFLVNESLIILCLHHSARQDHEQLQQLRLVVRVPEVRDFQAETKLNRKKSSMSLFGFAFRPLKPNQLETKHQPLLKQLLHQNLLGRVLQVRTFGLVKDVLKSHPNVKTNHSALESIKRFWKLFRSLGSLQYRVLKVQQSVHKTLFNFVKKHLL